jgi:hypothetical protein
MPGSKKNFIGLEGFIWWIGVVEDRNDPEQLGRVRVRCFGWHTENKSLIPTDSLPWAHPVTPVNSPNVYTPKEGDMVFGFFIDGDNAQNPAIVGVLPGKPEQKPKYESGFSDPGTNLSSRPKKPDDPSEKYPKSKYLKESTVNRLARGKSDGTIIATRKKNLKKNIKSAGGVTWSEPPPSFAPKYPYNNALETESGHALEFDDTPGKERVHLAHRSGAYTEFDKDGSKIERVQKDNYCVIMGDDFIYVKGKASITVEGNFNLKTSKINIEASEINMAADGAVKIKGSSVKIESTGGMDLKAGKAGKFTAGGRLDLKGATAGLGGATVDIPAGKVNMQGGSVSSASGTGLKGGGTTPSAEEVSSVSAESSNVTTANSVSASTDKLEEVKITSKKVEINAGSVLGKIAAGITSTVSGVANSISQATDSVLKDFANKLPTGELVGNVTGLSSAINETKSDILSLDKLQKSTLLSKINEVSKLSFNSNIDFKLDKDIQNGILSNVYNVNQNQLNSVLGKRTYPKTETVELVNPTLSAEFEDVIVRFASQELDPEEGGV